MTFTGADTQQLRDLAVRLASAADRLDHLRVSLGRQVESSTWDGRDADAFRADWYGHWSRILVSASTSLTQAAVTVRGEADQQDDASRDDGGTGGGGLFGGLPGSVGAPVGAEIAGWLQQIGGAAAVLGLSVGGTASLDGLFGSPAERARTLQGVLAAIKDPQVRMQVERSWSERWATGAGVDGAGRVGSVPWQASASVEASAEVRAGATATLSSAGLAAQAEAGAVIAVRAQAAGSLGNDTVGADGHAHVEASAGAQVSGDVKFGPHGATASAGADVGARLEAGASASAHVSGVEAGVTGKAYVGVTAHAHVSGSISMESVSGHVDIGAALGVGGGISFDYDIDPSDVFEDASSLVEKWSPW